MSAPLASASPGIGSIILERAGEVAETLVARQFERDPQLEVRYGKRGRDRCLEDAKYHLSYLADAVANDRPDHFAGYVAFVREMLARRGVMHLDESLGALREASADLLPEPARSSALRVLAVRE